MNRRTFLAGTGAMLLAAPLAAEAQRPGQILPRIGFLGIADAKSAAEPFQAFRQGLHELGWIEGQTITMEYRWANGQAERLPELASELVRAKSDIIVVSGSIGVQAARQATNHIPIVIVALLVDPVSAGFVASFAQPGGNITGLASQYEEVVTKQVQLLTEAVPGLSRLVFLGYKEMRASVQATAAAAAGTLGLKTRLLEVREVADFEGAFRKAREGRAQAIHVLPSPFLNAHRRLLIDLGCPLPSARHVRVPGIRSRRRSHVLRRKPPGHVPACGELCRSHSQGGESGRPSDRTAHKVRARDQSQDRRGARPDHPAVVAGAGG